MAFSSTVSCNPLLTPKSLANRRFSDGILLPTILRRAILYCTVLYLEIELKLFAPEITPAFIHFQNDVGHAINQRLPDAFVVETRRYQERPRLIG